MEQEERFKETVFVKNGGSCFECCDYEEMYAGLIYFIQQEIVSAVEEERNIQSKLREIAINNIITDTNIARQEERKHIVEIIEDYFKDLVYIPNPELTKESILKRIEV